MSNIISFAAGDAIMSLIGLATYIFIILTNIVKYLAWFYCVIKVVIVGFNIISEGKINPEVLSRNKRSLIHIGISMFIIAFSYSIISGLYLVMNDVTSQKGSTQINETPTDSITITNLDNKIAYSSREDVFYINS